jgi:hypothetical protein
MKNKRIKKIALISSGITLILVGVLAVHIYLVTRPQNSEATRIVMARIDFKQDIDDKDASAITEWLYTQQGVNHVLCNPETNIAIFTFLPSINNADDIVASLSKSTGYVGQRFMPNEKELMGGCPVAMGSWTSKVSGFFGK